MTHSMPEWIKEGLNIHIFNKNDNKVTGVERFI